MIEDKEEILNAAIKTNNYKIEHLIEENNKLHETIEDMQQPKECCCVQSRDYPTEVKALQDKIEALKEELDISKDTIKMLAMLL